MKKLFFTGSLLLVTLLTGSVLAQEAVNQQENLGLTISVAMSEFNSALSIKPNEINPSSVLDIEVLNYPVTVGYQVVDQNGNILLFGEIEKKEKELISFNDLNDGAYYLNVMDGNTATAAFVTIQKTSFSAQLENEK
jgi:hypothetical protein